MIKRYSKEFTPIFYWDGLAGKTYIRTIVYKVNCFGMITPLFMYCKLQHKSLLREYLLPVSCNANHIQQCQRGIVVGYKYSYTIFDYEKFDIIKDKHRYELAIRAIKEDK